MTRITLRKRMEMEKKVKKRDDGDCGRHPREKKGKPSSRLERMRL